MNTPIDIRDAFFDELYEIASQDPSVIFMTADMGAFSLERFRRDFPQRFINVGIAEQNLVSVAAGMALQGKKVFIYAIIPFITLRCLEQIKVDLCVMNLPVTIVGAGAGFTYSSDGPTHHAIEDVSIMRALPGMTIYNPSDQSTAKMAARNAYTETGPVYVRLDKGVWPNLHQTEDDLSKGFSLLKSGTKLLVIATGCMTHVALQVAEAMCDSGINPSIVDLFRLKPVAEELLKIVKEYERVVTIEEHMLPGGMGAAVLELFADRGLMIPVKRLGIMDIYPEEYGDRAWMRKELFLGFNQIVRTVKEFYTDTDVSGCLELKLNDFAELLNNHIDTFSEECKDLIFNYDFRYIYLDSIETKEYINKALHKLESGKMSVAGKEKKELWEKGWAENLNEFVKEEYDIKKLKPKYYHPHSLLRIKSLFAKGIDPDFEFNFFKVLRLWFFDNYLKNKDSIYEFGCGPGHNLVEIAQRYPEKKLVGLDWTEASVNLVNKIAKVHGYNIIGIRFDMFHPEYSLDFVGSNAVITMGALEQLGSDYDEFLEFLLYKSPDICINIEPLIELYDENKIEDYLAILHHKKRNLLGNYLTTLREIESQNRINILRVQRVPFGGALEEGWSYVVWKPVRK